MTQPLSQILARAAILSLAFVSVAGVAAAVDMTEPTQTPPAGNVAAPVNPGGADQVKDGGISGPSFGSSDGYLLSPDTGDSSGWFKDAATGLTTFVAEQFCIGTNPNAANGNTCVTSFGGGSYHLERKIILHIPSSQYGYQQPYYDYCENALNGSGPLSASDGWVATGSDNCAEYSGDGDNCNGSHKAGPLQCTYMRLMKGSESVAAISLIIPYGYDGCTLGGQRTYCPFDRDGNAIDSVSVTWFAPGATGFTLQGSSVTPADHGSKDFSPPGVGETQSYTGKITSGVNSGDTCTMTVKRGTAAQCNGNDDGGPVE